ncbi:MAG: hypothetical protein ACTSRH_12270 [Promethearchaeota archaeon]
MLSTLMNVFGISILGNCPNFLGSVSFPSIAETAAVSGLTKYTFALLVPDLPRKLRLKVLNEIAFVQAFSKILAPASTK